MSVPSNDEPSGVQPDRPADQVHHGGLPGAVRADHTERLALVHTER